MPRFCFGLILGTIRPITEYMLEARFKFSEATAYI